MSIASVPVPASPADPAIQAALAGVSASRLRQTVETLVAFGNRNTLSSMETDLKSGQGVSAAADWIESQFKAISADCGGCLEVRRDTFTEPANPPPSGRIPRPTTISNVYAVLRGIDASGKRMLLVTGHYDSRNSDTFDDHSPAPGANDDASGVAVSLECARVLSRLKLPATLVFVAVAGEEQGLNGSRHLAKLAKAEGWQLEGVLNNDIVGGNTTPGDTPQDKSTVRVFSESIPAAASEEEVRRIVSLGVESDSPSRELARSVADAGRTYLPGFGGFHPTLEFRRDRFLRGGDHSSFNAEGFPAVRITEWREDFHHQHQNVRVEGGIQYGDLIQFVDFGYLANVARLNAATLATLAAAPPPPADVRIVTRNLDNDTTLTWNDPAGALSGTGFEIVWRETTAPDWQHAIAADRAALSVNGGSYSATLPVSKDNVIFGVRSVDKAGHRSPAVTPLPAR